LKSNTIPAFKGAIFRLPPPPHFSAAALAVEWPEIHKYQTLLALVFDISIVIDFAERGVTMIQEYGQFRNSANICSWLWNDITKITLNEHYQHYVFRQILVS